MPAAPRALLLLALRPSALPLAALLGLAGCAGAHRPPARFDGALLPPGLRAPAFTLADRDGRSVSLSSRAGRVRLIAFLSASQRSSLLVAQQIRGALDELGAPSTLVSTLIVSTSPRDGRAAIGRFLGQAALAGRARYLSGPPRRLRAIWKAYGVLPASAGEAAFLASTPVVLVDRHGVERVGFGVEQLTPEALAHDLRLLLGS
jgi:cytochrome oxidase Cu insertion factor (SCO1/SenC/PrrC family)